MTASQRGITPPQPNSKNEPETASQRVLVCNSDRCTGYRCCEIACPTFAIGLMSEGDDKIVSCNHEKCISCASCEIACPEDAVHLKAERHPPVTRKGKRKLRSE